MRSLAERRRIDRAGEAASSRIDRDRLAREFVAGQVSTRAEAMEFVERCNSEHARLRDRLMAMTRPTMSPWSPGIVKAPPAMSVEDAARQIAEHAELSRSLIEATRVHYEDLLRRDLADVSGRLRQRRSMFGSDAAAPEFRSEVDRVAELINPGDLVARYEQARLLTDGLAERAVLAVGLDRCDPEILDAWATRHPADVDELTEYRELTADLTDRDRRLHRGFAFLLTA